MEGYLYFGYVDRIDEMIKIAESVSYCESKINTEIFRDYVGGSPEFEDALNIAKKNSTGKIWVIGSFVYRNIIKEIYRRRLQRLSEIDIDFLVEDKSEERMYIPRGWELRMTGYLNPYFSQKEKKIRVDLNFLPNMHSILTRNLEPILKHFLTGTPLTIQSLAYDCNKKIIFGNIGKSSIEQRKVKINNLGEAGFEANKRGITLGELVKEKADELKFNYVLP